MISFALCEALHCWEGTLLIKQKAKDVSCSSSGRRNFYFSSRFCCCSLTVIPTLLVYVHESWAKGGFLHFISLLDVIFQQYILQLPEQSGSAWVSHIASQLEKYDDVLRKADQIRSPERLFWWHWVWNITHCSYRGQNYIFICIFVFLQMSHFTKEKYMSSKTIFCLPFAGHL